MTKVVYEVVEHDGGFAYRMNGAYSKHFLPMPMRSRPRASLLPNSRWAAMMRKSAIRTNAASGMRNIAVAATGRRRKWSTRFHRRPDRFDGVRQHFR